VSEKQKDELFAAKGTGTPIVQSAPDAEFQMQRSGKSVYDMGESVVAKMNRVRAMFDVDEFFQDLYENYLVSVLRHEPRQHPDSRIITHWDERTTFEDFTGDSLKIINKKIEAAKFAKAVGTTRMAAIDKSVFNDPTFKQDAGSAAVGKTFDTEDYEAVYELLCISKESIEDYHAGRLTLVINAKTGRCRVGGSTGL